MMVSYTMRDFKDIEWNKIQREYYKWKSREENSKKTLNEFLKSMVLKGVDALL